MNKFEFEHMVSLVDEKYIDEMFTDRLHNKKNKIFAGLCAAAAVIALICGIGFISGKINKDTDDIIADTTPDSIIIDEPVDYSQYFLNNEGYLFGFYVEPGWISCQFEAKYIKQFMPFDTSSYDDGAVSNIHFDHKDEAKYYGISLTGPNGISENANRMLGITVGKEGSILSRIPNIDRCTPVERLGVDVYGAEHASNYELYGFPSCFLMFSCGGRDYSISAGNMTYDEIGMIMDSIIRDGIPVENIELSEAYDVEYRDVDTVISLAEANTIKPFAGCVPQLDRISDMQLDGIGDMRYTGTVSYFARRNEAYELVPEYISYHYYKDSEKNMDITFFTKDSYIVPSEKTLQINNVTPGIFEHYMEDGNLFCTIECDGFKINIWANNCTDDEIYIFKNAVWDAISAPDKSDEISLAEAGQLKTFAGYVPQLEKIGDMNFRRCEYNSYANAEEELSVSYYSPDKEKGLWAFYESGGEPGYIMTDYVRLEDIAVNVVHDFGNPSGIEGCSVYSLTVDCGSFRIHINAICTPDEMWTWLSEVKKAYDGSELNYSGEHPLESEQVTLEYANEATAFSGFVPQLESIGGMTVGDVLYSEFFLDNKPVDSTLHIEYHDGDRFIITSYKQDLNMSDAGTIKFEDLTEDSAERFAGWSKLPDADFYNIAVRCGEFNIYIVGECSPETMREYIRQLKEHCPKYTALTLEEAAASGLTGGYVPMTEKIGDMTLEDGYCRIEEQPEVGQILRIKYRNTDFKYQNKTYNYYGKYISTFYFKSDSRVVGAAKFDDIAPAPSIDGIDLGDSQICKYRFVIDCGDGFYIRVESLCDEIEMWEYFTALKAAAANIGQ
ncbi:MAG: hypothetical protein J1F11_04470 [Oscillospiraceae bacterium]|nr:hypothetical protein [Oscillospiraceae bacterium]